MIIRTDMASPVLVIKEMPSFNKENYGNSTTFEKGD